MVTKGKKRVYSPPQEALDIVKEEMKRLGLKSNNSQAVNYSVYVMAKIIQSEVQTDKK